MTREEIREGIRLLYRCAKDSSCFQHPEPCAFDNQTSCEWCNINKFLSFLDSQGVVLRKDGHVEFNLTGIPPTPTQMSAISKAYKEAGYEAVASLM